MSVKNIMKKSIKSCLSENDLFDYKAVKPNKFLNLFSLRVKKHETKNLFNNIYNLKLKGKEKYQNFSVFAKREISLDKNGRLRLNLSLKKFPSSIKYKKNIMHNSLYLSPNIIKGDCSKLPLLLENSFRSKNKNEKTKSKKKKSIKEKYSPNINKEEITNRNVRTLFLNKLKFSKKDKELKKHIMNETDGYLFNKQNFSYSRYRNSDSSSIEYIDKLHEYLVFKNNIGLKRELLLQTNDFNSNKIEKVDDQIKSLNDNRKIMNILKVYL